MPKIDIQLSPFYDFAKRSVDILFSILLLLIFSPVIFLVALAIKTESEGTILADTPERVGKNGKKFKMYKFRSMVKNAHTILRQDPKYADLYSQYKKGSYKLKDDPRVTKVGRVIRKFSLDELPQFFNVLNGEMSIVGPRAYYPDELEEQQKKYPHTRGAVKVVLSVKPGITGFWQVTGRSEINFDKRIQMDANYAKRRSVIYDLWIILKTPWAMISGRGAL
ncbi:MAG TPA: sugar transferase [Candidatus Limnocylindrales bacterium]|nr:sugar transferase [Candidatus Limnocylindrales bacterium]